MFGLFYFFFPGQAMLFPILNMCVQTYVVPKEDLVYHRPQRNKVDHKVWQSYWNENPTKSGQMILEGTLYTMWVLIFFFFFSYWQSSLWVFTVWEVNKKTWRPPNEKTTRNILTWTRGIWRTKVMWSMNETAKLQISKHKIMCNLGF